MLRGKKKPSTNGCEVGSVVFDTNKIYRMLTWKNASLFISISNYLQPCLDSMKNDDTVWIKLLWTGF